VTTAVSAFIETHIEEGIERFGICCCPDTNALNQRWRVSTWEDLDLKIKYAKAHCVACGRKAGADR
jgi:hypothetical protein